MPVVDVPWLAHATQPLQLPRQPARALARLGCCHVRLFDLGTRSEYAMLQNPLLIAFLGSRTDSRITAAALMYPQANMEEHHLGWAHNQTTEYRAKLRSAPPQALLWFLHGRRKIHSIYLDVPPPTEHHP